MAFGLKPTLLSTFKPNTPDFMLPQWIHTSGRTEAIAVNAERIEEREERREGGEERVRERVWVSALQDITLRHVTVQYSIVSADA